MVTGAMLGKRHITLEVVELLVACVALLTVT